MSPKRKVYISKNKTVQKHLQKQTICFMPARSTF